MYFLRFSSLRLLRKLACQAAILFIEIESKVIFRKNATRARLQANSFNNSGETEEVSISPLKMQCIIATAVHQNKGFMQPIFIVGSDRK